jgi:hypothetical protein
MPSSPFRNKLQKLVAKLKRACNQRNPKKRQNSFEVIETATRHAPSPRHQRNLIALLFAMGVRSLNESLRQEPGLSVDF